MLDHILAITQFMLNAFLHVWPYLLITIPLAVAVQMSGASKYINRAFAARPVIAIFLATAESIAIQFNYDCSPDSARANFWSHDLCLGGVEQSLQ